MLLAVIAVFGFVLYRSLPFLMEAEPLLMEAFTSRQWLPNNEPPVFGMLSLFYGSFIVTVLAMFIAAPIGVLSAIVLSDLVPFRIRQFLKPIIELLAAIPSVVFGFFAVKTLAPFMQDTLGFSSGTNVLNASVILAVMVIPMVISVSEDVLSGIGRQLREASFALGSTRAETLLFVILPACRNSITAALLLGTMRAVGETMVVWMAAGNAANMPSAWYRVDEVLLGLGGAVRTMTATIAGDIGETPADSLHRSALFTLGLLLLIFTFLMNMLTEYLVSRNSTAPKGMGRTVKTACSYFGLRLSFLFPSGHISRRMFDKCFTFFAYLSFSGLFAVLCVMLIPIFTKGTEAVFFQETVEHRLFLYENFHRGNKQNLEYEFNECYAARQIIYQQIEKLSWLAPEQLLDETIKKSAKQNGIKPNRKLQRAVKELIGAETADKLTDAYQKINKLTEDKNEPLRHFAERYYETAKNADLSLRNQTSKYDPNITLAAAFRQIRTLITGVEGTGCVIGPDVAFEDRSSIEHLPPEVRYGPAHWSSAQRFLQRLQSATLWLHNEKQQQQKTAVQRAALFEGTGIEKDIQKLIDDTANGLEKMLRPQRTFYGNYFFDSATAGHYLGGIGHELLGTVFLSVLSIILAFPLTVITAAYLTEVAKDNTATRILRLCISTLAGVPSIVFGLFGLSVIVELITGKPCLAAGVLTLTLLVLPVMVRTAEEAIRNVPQTYREASIGLGAGSVRTFFSVILPAALPGMLTGTILGISRVAGETAPLMFTCATAAGGIVLGWNFLLQPVPVLSYSAYDIAVGDRLADIVPYNQYGMVAALITFVFILNFAAIILRGYITAKHRY